MRVLLILLLIMAMAVNADAAETNIDIGLHPSGLVHEKLLISFVAEEDSEQLVYSLVNKPENLIVKDGNRDVSYEIAENGIYNIVIEKSIRRGQSYKILMEFDIKGLVEQLDNKYLFSFRYEPSEAGNLVIRVELPAGFVLADIDSAVSPKPSRINTDGRN